MNHAHKNIRRPGRQYVGTHRYFLTMCCAERRPVLSEPANARWLIEELREKCERYLFAAEAYCVMPDHFHVLLRGLEEESDLLAFVKAFKQSTGYEFQKKFQYALWQKKFYDHILRTGESAEGVAGYIWANPVRKGICNDPREYAFSGSLVHLWKELISPKVFWEPPWKSGVDESQTKATPK